MGRKFMGKSTGASAPRWMRPRGSLQLDGDDVHVWRINVPAVASSPSSPYLPAVLSSHERERGDGFPSDAHRRQFIVGRATLRLILGAFIGAPASALAFAFGTDGKPALAQPYSQSGIEFNLAHSGDWVVCAITRGRAVGIDIERTRRVASVAHIARFLFSSAEQHALAMVGARCRERTFFDIWTRKEACVKAKGRSLLAVAANSASQSARRSGAHAVNVDGCSVRALTVAAGYSAALATAGSLPPPKLFHCNSAFLTSRLNAERDRNAMAIATPSVSSTSCPGPFAT